MGAPSNPLVRAVTAVATGGLSEVPNQFKAAGQVVQGTIQGDPVSGLKRASDQLVDPTSDQPKPDNTLGEPPATPAAPELDPTTVQAAQDDETRRLRSGAGKASTILTSPGTGLGSSGRRTLGAA